MPSILEGVFSSSEDELNKMLVSLVGMPKADIEAELSIIKSRVEEVAQTIPTKGNKGDKGDKGDQGIQGPKGEPGRDGRDGFIGKDGKQGVDGKDGIDGKDGVSIVDVTIAFDNHLVVTLSDGTEIDAGVIGSIGDNLQNVVANYISNGANGTLIYKGLWNASTNTPTLSLSSSDAGAYYVVSVAGSTNLSGITDWQVNDWAIFNGTEWQKIDNSDLFNASAVAITGGSINGTTIGATTASTGKFTSVTTPSVTATTTDLTLSAISTGVVNLNTLNGTGLRLSELAGGTVNTGFAIFSGTSSQNTVYTVPYGTFANSNMYLASKGSGNLFLGTNSNNSATPTTQALIAHTASAVNYVQVTGAATGQPPAITAQGSDSNVNMTLRSKGTGYIGFTSGGGSGILLGLPNGSANYFTAASSNAGFSPTLSVAGSDTNISLALTPKGTGALQAQANSGTTTGGNARGANAVDWQMVRAGATQVASGQYSTISGGDNNTSAGYSNVVGGGESNTANSYIAAICGGAGVQATGSYSFIGGGLGSISQGPFSAISGGFLNRATGYFNVIGGGEANSGTANAAVTTQATSSVTSGSSTVTLTASNASIKVGQFISGTGIVGYPNSTYVAAISGTTLTLSQNANATGTPTLSFFTPHGVVVGGGNNQATGAYSFIGGGGDAGTAAQRNVASGDWSVVCGGANNKATGAGSFIGTNATINNANTASGAGAVIVGGTANNSTNTNTFVGAGYGNLANGYISGIVAGTGAQSKSIWGAMHHATNNFSTQGDAQRGEYVQMRQTTNATTTQLTCGNVAPSNTVLMAIPNNQTYSFRTQVTARNTSNGDSAAWEIKGLIKRGANAASTAIVGSVTVTSIASDAGASTWAVTATADTTYGALSINVTGVAATTIRWVAQTTTVEVG